MSSHGPERGVSSVSVLYLKSIITNFVYVSCCSENTLDKTDISKSFTFFCFVLVKEKIKMKKETEEVNYTRIQRR